MQTSFYNPAILSNSDNEHTMNIQNQIKNQQNLNQNQQFPIKHKNQRSHPIQHSQIQHSQIQHSQPSCQQTTTKFPVMTSSSVAPGDKFMLENCKHVKKQVKLSENCRKMLRKCLKKCIENF